MKIIGIDFSILYPGFCISEDFKTFQHFAVTNNRLTKKDTAYFEDLTLKYKGVNIVQLGERKKKAPEYHINERQKLKNFDALTDTIISQLSHYVPTKDSIISIEGISFGSSGNSLVDISQATGILKSKLLNNLTDSVDKIFMFSPSALKNAIGAKGNASKTDVFLQFLENPIIPGLRQSDFYKLIKAEKDIIFDPSKNKGKGDVKSPFMDMVDSTLPIIKIYEILKKNPDKDDE